MRAWLGLEPWQLGGVGKQAELWPSAPRWGAVKRRTVLRTKSTWHFLGLPRCAWDWSLLRGLESLCWMGPSRDRDQVWVGMSRVFFTRP